MKLTSIPSPVAGARAFYTSSNCSVMVASEPSGPKGEMRWHMSIAHRNRYPHWDEIREARYQLIPNDVTMCMVLPPVSEYVNVHSNCFHLFQLQEEELAGYVKP